MEVEASPHWCEADITSPQFKHDNLGGTDADVVGQQEVNWVAALTTGVAEEHGVTERGAGASSSQTAFLSTFCAFSAAAFTTEIAFSATAGTVEFVAAASAAATASITAAASPATAALCAALLSLLLSWLGPPLLGPRDQD